MSRRKAVLAELGVQTWSQRSPRDDSKKISHGAHPGDAKPKKVAETPTSAPAPIEASTRTPVIPPTSTPAIVPSDWAVLRAAVKDCRACRLCETRTQTVFGVGPESAPLMVVGEGPGADEDASGLPFVGRAGKLLDEMLKAIGHSRTTNTYIANVVKCRPPENREPAEDEAEACHGYLQQQLRLVKPKLILALGRTAAQRLLKTDEALSKLRGPMHTWGADATPLMITYHPAYLLRSPGEKAKSWEDLKKVHRFLAGA